MSRRAVLTGLGASALTLGSANAAAPAVKRNAGNFRSLHLTNWRTGEWINTVYWADGQYIDEALKGFDHLLRDWREDLTIRIDRGAIDILSTVQRMLDASEPFEVVSGYRCEKTNRMLRRSSGAVAKNSYHTKGMACDITMKSRSVAQISGAGLALGRGGVGKYTRSNFVHLDSGPVRDWGR